MAKRSTAHLPTGMTLLDFASPSRILQAFNGDMKAMRAEYSRERSILRKRVERMEQKGEVYNKFYNYYGDLQKSMPSARGLSDKTVMYNLMSTAQAIGGGYKSTIEELRESRQDAVMALVQDAAKQDDKEFVFSFLNDKLTEKQKENAYNLLKAGKSGELPPKAIKQITAEEYAKAKKILGMIQKVSIASMPYNIIFNDALKTVLHESGKKKPKGLLRMAADLIDGLGIELEEDENPFIAASSKPDAMKTLKGIYNNQGRQKISYKKAHKKRGK